MEGARASASHFSMGQPQSPECHFLDHMAEGDQVPSSRGGLVCGPVGPCYSQPQCTTYEMTVNPLSRILEC